MSFEEDLKAASEAELPTKDVDVTLNGSLYTLRFTLMDGTEWAACTDQAPARPGVLLDTHYGYNMRALVYIVAPKSGQMVDGDSTKPLTDDQWRALLKALPGGPMMRIGDTLFALNEYEPGEAVEAAKKASRAATAATSS